MNLSEYFRKLGGAAPRLAAYLMFVLGAALLVKGVWMLSHAAAFIVAGLLLGVGGFLAAIAPDPFEEEF